jgi:uracil-DNA glycosylase
MPSKRVRATEEVIDVDGAEEVKTTDASDGPVTPVSKKAAPKASPAKKIHPLFQKGEVVASNATSASIPKGGLADTIVDEKWRNLLAPILTSSTFQSIEKFLQEEESKGKQIFPPRKDIFAALNYVPFDQLKVVLIGQDPYHDDDQAHGLCFSVQPGIKPPPSLVNMYKELATDIPGFKAPDHGYLTSWARQGILMLNATLTVEAHRANSHAGIGWQTVTDYIIKTISDKSVTPIVFLLWGGFAQKKAKLIDKRHKIFSCAHPSPLSVTKWMGCKTFSQCNDLLRSVGKTPIDWTLPMSVSQEKDWKK